MFFPYAQNEMNVTGHDAVSVQVKPFVLGAVDKAISDDLPVLIADKDVHPVDDGKGDEVDGLLVVDSVFSGHGGRVRLRGRPSGRSI